MMYTKIKQKTAAKAVFINDQVLIVAEEYFTASIRSSQVS